MNDPHNARALKVTRLPRPEPVRFTNREHDLRRAVAAVIIAWGGDPVHPDVALHLNRLVKSTSEGSA